MKSLRQQRGLSAKQLAEEMTKAGIPWDRSVVANFESGRRSYVTVEEMLMLAYVLEVAPVHLMVSPWRHSGDRLEDRDVKLLPLARGGLISHTMARAWIRGQYPAGADERRYFSEVPESEFELPPTRVEDPKDAA